jgi:hypothetical protein
MKRKMFMQLSRSTTEAGQDEPARPADSRPPVRYDQPWLTSFLRPFLIITLVTCLNIAWIGFLRRFLPMAPAVFFQSLLAIGILTAWVGVITTTWLAQPAQRLQRTAAYRVAEIVLILLLARLILWMTTTPLPSLSEFVLHPVYSLLDGYFLVAILVAVVAWVMATEFSSNLLELAIQPDEMYVAKRSSRDVWDTSRGGSDRQALMDSFVGRWVTGGVLLILFATGSQLDLAVNGFFAILHQNIDPAVILAAIVYFFVGLLLISQGQLAMLRARWAIEGVPSSDAVARNWPGYVLIVLLAVGLLAALAPFGGTRYLSLAISVILKGIYIFVFLIIRLFMLLMVLLMALLPFTQAPEPPTRQAFTEAVTTPPPPPPPAYFAWIGGALFWVVTALLLGYAAYIYFSGKGLHFERIARLWVLLKLRWRRIWQSFRGWRTAHFSKAPSVASSSAAGRGGWRAWLNRFNPRSLTPEQRVRYYYLAMLEEAARIGAPRRKSETPTRYAPRLIATLNSKDPAPDLAEDSPEIGPETVHEPSLDAAHAVGGEVEKLTENFVRIRYAGQVVEETEAGSLETTWQELKRRFQRCKNFT